MTLDANLERLAPDGERKLKRHARVAYANRQRRLHLYEAMVESLDGRVSEEELDIHFTHMPARYWTRVTEESLTRHLTIIHAFLAALISPESDGTAPAVHWRHCPDRGVTEVEVCTWDRLGLLAKVAGAFAAVGLNIVRADIYTRVDNVVLDIFEITEPEGGVVRDESLLRAMADLLETSLRAGPLDATSLPASIPAPAVTAPEPIAGGAVVSFDILRNDAYTVLQLEAVDRVGLLYAIFSALADGEVNVAHAIITTDNGRAGDVFFLTDADGHRITDPARLERLRHRVLARLA